MNRYETWLSQQRVGAPTRTDTRSPFEQLFRIYQRALRAAEGELICSHSVGVPGLSTGVVDTERSDTLSRSAHRLEQDRVHNIDFFRAFLNYGQGLNRTRRTS